MTYEDRSHAGRILALHLSTYGARQDAVVLGLPRGGVTVAAEVADALDLSLDVFVVRKIGMPANEEVAMGAVASGGVRILHADLVRQVQATDPGAVDRAIERAQRQLDRLERLYRGNRPGPSITGRVVVLVDDGMATGASMEAAVTAIQSLHPGRLVVAIPVAPPETCTRLLHKVDEVVCPMRPVPFRAVPCRRRLLRVVRARGGRRGPGAAGGGPRASSRLKQVRGAGTARRALASPLERAYCRCLCLA